MREQTYHIYLDSHQKTTLLQSLVELKNQLIQQGRYTDWSVTIKVEPILAEK